MSEEQIIAILGEIRDLQKQHVENYKVAVQNQQQSIEIQKHAVRRQKTAFVVIGVVLAALYLLPVFWWGLSWMLRCTLRH